MFRDKKTETKHGIKAGIVGILANILLFGSKIAVGLISGSITIVADAVNNLADASSNVVTVIGFKLSSRPADEDHPFGHERIEQICALLVAIIVLAVGVLLGKSSVEKIITPEPITVSIATYIVLAIGIVGKLGLMAFLRLYGKKIDSDSLLASSADARNDAISTTAVLISTIVIATTGVNIDGYMGLAVSIFIVISALLMFKEIISPLLGERADKEFVTEVRKKLLSYQKILGIHDLVVHLYGKTPYVTVHAEVDAKDDFIECHDIIDNVEREFLAEGVHLSIHMDPIETDNPEVETHKIRAIKVLSSIDEGLHLHDFRIVKGDTHTNILFDVVVPYNSKITLKDIHEALGKEYENDEKQYFFVLSVDREYA